MSKRKSDKWIPWYFVMFFVGLTILNGIMVTIAVRSYTGTVVSHPYEKGLNYNKTIAAAEAQEARGWKGDIRHEGKKLYFTLENESGQPVALKEVKANFFRPTQQGYDFNQVLKFDTVGNYSAEVNFPLPGLWEVQIFALAEDNSAEGKTYQQSTRLVIHE